jgi:hypothetical protein
MENSQQRTLKFRWWATVKYNPASDKAYRLVDEKFSDHFDTYKWEEDFNNFDEWYKARGKYLNEVLPKDWTRQEVYEDKMIYKWFSIYDWIHITYSNVYEIKNIMQFTGIKDLFQTEIYEWDIAIGIWWNIWVVEYCQEEWKYVLKFKCNKVKRWWDFNWVNRIERVLWNIYENSNLLTK